MKFLQREDLVKGQRRTEILCNSIQEFFILCNVLNRKFKLIKDYYINRNGTTRAVHFYNEVKNLTYSILYRGWEDDFNKLEYIYKYNKEHTIRLNMRNNKQLIAWTNFFKDIADKVEIDYLSLTKIYYVADYIIKVKIEID
jgi:hypothetical protein